MENSFRSTFLSSSIFYLCSTCGVIRTITESESHTNGKVMLTGKKLHTIQLLFCDIVNGCSPEKAFATNARRSLSQGVAKSRRTPSISLSVSLYLSLSLPRLQNVRLTFKYLPVFQIIPRFLFCTLPKHIR